MSLIHAAAQPGGRSRGKPGAGQIDVTTGADDQLAGPGPGTCAASPAPKPVTVLIVEDSSIVRERLVALIADVRNVVVVGEAEDGFQAQALFRQHRPDAVVLDLQLPGIGGLDLLPQFKREQPGCVVMVLTTYAFKEFRQRCAVLGADHFFDKSTEFERVTEVLAAFPAREQLGRGSESKPEEGNASP